MSQERKISDEMRGAFVDGQLDAADWARVVGLALVLLDALAGVQLPQPFRSALPWLLVISSGVGITLLVGALGTPKREAKAPKAPSSD